MVFRNKFNLAVLTMLFTSLFGGCLFENVNQPSSAQPGEVIDVSLTIIANDVPEPNAHKGILGIIAPDDWEFVSASYTSALGNGDFMISPEWTDSVNMFYPVSQFGTNMKWITLISDSGYAHTEITTFEVALKLKVGQTEGCFNIGYLTTKATSGMLENPSWSPLSYPHPIGIPDSGACVSIYETRRAPEWDDLLDRNSGWTGSDGIYSIPLNGFDAPSDNPSDRHLIAFSDTFIGDVNPDSSRAITKMVNNTLALLQSNIPDPDQIEFFWRLDSQNNPASVFVPNTPTANPGDWYWLMDGIAIDSTIYLYALRLNSTGGGGGFGFEVNGVVLLKFRMDDENFISNVEQFDTPLFYKNETENMEIVLGQAIMPMTEISGSPSPDGYIYVYGPGSGSGGKELLAARVLPENIENFEEYEYWDGNVWGDQIANLAPLTNGISQEFSVTPVANGQVLLVYQTGSSVAVRLGESPTGPFGIFHVVYDCPEIEIDPDIFVYNAKAHPSLSTTEELLISYNVNSFEFADHFSNADIYRPRFIYLKINDSTITAAGDNVKMPDEYSLAQNYPNPFNPFTKISFSIPARTEVSVKIFNPLGEMITEIVNREFSAGHHEISFSPSGLSSGVYFYRIEAGGFIQTRKMVYLK